MKNKRRDTKYIAKVPTGKKGEYRYFYDKDEYQAYLDNIKPVTLPKSSDKQINKPNIPRIPGKAPKDLTPEPNYSPKGKSIVIKEPNYSRRDLSDGMQFVENNRHLRLLSPDIVLDEIPIIPSNAAKKTYKNDVDVAFEYAKKHSVGTQINKDGSKSYSVEIDPHTYRTFREFKDGSVWFCTTKVENYDENESLYYRVDENGNISPQKTWIEKADTSSKVEFKPEIGEKTDRLKYVVDEQSNYPKDSLIHRIPKLNTLETPDQSMDNINERYYQADGYKNNCFFCSATYELRRRGYDVDVAIKEDCVKDNKLVNEYVNGLETVYSDYSEDMCLQRIDIIKNTGTSPYLPIDGETIYTSGKTSDYTIADKISVETYDSDPSYKKYFGERKVRQYDSYNDLFADEQFFARDSRGEIEVTWILGSGHSMIYEVDHNGTVIIRDTQTHDVYTGSQIDDLFSLCSRVSAVRTDNLHFSEDFLKYAIRKN